MAHSTRPISTETQIPCRMLVACKRVAVNWSALQNSGHSCTAQHWPLLPSTSYTALQHGTVLVTGLDDTASCCSALRCTAAHSGALQSAALSTGVRTMYTYHMSRTTAHGETMMEPVNNTTRQADAKNTQRLQRDPSAAMLVAPDKLRNQRVH